MSSFINDNRRTIKALLLGVGISALVGAVLLCLCALILTFVSSVPYGILDWLTVAVAGIAALVGAYIAGAVAKSRGLINGLVTAAILLLILLAFGLSRKGESVTALTAARAGVMLLCGALGGIKGVNRKDRIRIK